MGNLRYIAFILALSLVGASANIQADPVPLPNPGIPGYAFPEAESTIMRWVNDPTADNRKAIDLHGWGLWAALTTLSGQSEFGISNVPVYFTWRTPQEIARGTGTAANASGVKPKRVFQLELPRQFRRDKVLMHSLEKTVLPPPVPGTPLAARDNTSEDTVGYDPTAAAFAQQHNLFSMAALKTLFLMGNTSIPSFPNTAVVIKPEYKVISKEHIISGHYFVMPAWPGTPDASTVNPSHGFPESAWHGCVYIDISNFSGSSARGIDNDCSGPTAQNTYNLGDFITYLVTAANVDQFKSLSPDTTIEPGDFVILIGMHVTTREITEWTWQSFFWTPDPDNPPLPSSRSVAADRPVLARQAAHYAMTIGYQMVEPNQLPVGGKSQGSPVIVYNPYLEASLGSDTFKSPPSPVNTGIRNTKTGQTFQGRLGIQTNCMACHGVASVRIADPKNDLGYVPDLYLSRTDGVFAGSLQTDFLWSISDDAK